MLWALGYKNLETKTVCIIVKVLLVFWCFYSVIVLQYMCVCLICIVGLRQPVISRQEAFRAGSNFLAWVDLSHTGLAYSAVE